MILLNKYNIADYIKNRTNILNNTDDLFIREIGDGLPEDDGDRENYDNIDNFIYKIAEIEQIYKSNMI